MITVDTNILVRYAIKDDKRQTEAATRFFTAQSMFAIADRRIRNRMGFIFPKKLGDFQE